MIKRIVRSLSVVVITAGIITFSYNETDNKAVHAPRKPVTVVEAMPLYTVKKKPTIEVEPVDEPVEEVDILMSDEDIELIALVTMAEAEGECEYGKRLVIDTILNRIDSEHFPDSASGVIYQANQFTSMWNGRVNRCTVKDDICDLVREELKSRTNSDVMFFTAGAYGNYGNPMFNVENHYFSSYN